MQTRNLKYWFINAVCGLLVLVLAGMHLFSFHLDDLMALVFSNSTEPLAWAQVSARGTSLAYVIGYIVLLGTALFHGFYGLHTVLTEIWSSQRASAAINILCWLFGLSLFATGVVAAVSFHVML